MTIIDGTRLKGSIPNVDGATLDRLEAWSISTGRSRAELVALMVDKFAPLADAGNMRPGSPGDGRGTGESFTPVPVHAHLDGAPCVYGDRCGQ